ncbi:MAG: GDSL-type esterase/lipase family protein [Rhodomicrobium sp.]|jgi:hypothetical protein
MLTQSLIKSCLDSEGSMIVGAFGRNSKMPFVSRAFPALGALSLCALLLILSGASQVRAQGASPLSSSYITPFPQTDRYQVRVIGDWLGAGLTDGLKEAFKLEEGSLQFADMSRSNYGLARADQTDLYREIDRMISDSPPHIVVVMLGVNDRASLKYGEGRVQPGSAEWKEAYAKEAERLIKKLRNAKIAVYWVGLPIMANAAFSETVAAMNDAARQAAYVNGAKFIETWAGFTDQLGAYAAYGPDLTGQTKRLRDGDGIGLTPAGNRKLANYVEIVLRRDLAQAKAQRNIPLAGDEEEQARVVPGVARSSAKVAAAPEWTASASQPRPDPANPSASKQPPVAAAAPALRTEPAAPPATPDPQKRDAAAFGGAGFQGGEYVLADLGDGLTSIAVISSVGDFSMREIQRQTPLADRAYFKVLSRGEALPSKEGRADDFRWPPPPETGAQ